MSYQTGYIYAIVNTIERVKLPQLQEAIQRLNEKTKMIQPNTDIMKQVAKLDTDVATIIKKLNLVDGEFKDDDITLLQSLSDKLTTTVETVNTMNQEMTKLKNDYYHLINLEHLSTLTSDIEYIKNLAKTFQNYAILSDSVNNNTSRIADTELDIASIDSYFDTLGVEKFSMETPDEKENNNGDGGESEGGESSGEESEQKKKAIRTANVKHNMGFIVSRILDMINIDTRIDDIEATLTKIDVDTLVNTSTIGSYIEKANINVDNLLPNAQYEVKTSMSASIVDWFKYILTHINMQYKEIEDEATGEITKLSFEQYLDKLNEELKTKYDANTLLAVGEHTRTIIDHLIELFTNKYDGNTQLNIGRGTKTIKEHIDSLYAKTGNSDNGSSLDDRITAVENNKYDDSTKLTVNAEAKTIVDHFTKLSSDVTDLTTDVASVTSTANKTSQRLSEYEQEINASIGSWNDSTAGNILNLEGDQTMCDVVDTIANKVVENEGTIQSVKDSIGDWTNTTINTTLDLDGEQTINTMTKAIDKLAGKIIANETIIHSINSSMSLFNGTVVSQNKVLLGNSYPTHNRNLIGLTTGANYEIIPNGPISIVPAEDMNGETIVVDSLYLESFTNEIVDKLKTVINSHDSVNEKVRIRLGPNVMLKDFLSTENVNQDRLAVLQHLFDQSIQNNKQIIIQCYASSLNDITSDNIKTYISNLCTTTQTTYNVVFVIYEYPPESDSVSTFVSTLNQTSEPVEGEGESTPVINYGAKLIYLF